MIPEWSQAVELAQPERWGVYEFVQLDPLTQDEIWKLAAGPFMSMPTLDSIRAMYPDKGFKVLKIPT